jgi:hypothetical protein
MTFHYYVLPVLYFEKLESNRTQAPRQTNHVQSAQMKKKRWLDACVARRLRQEEAKQLYLFFLDHCICMSLPLIPLKVASLCAI